MKKNIVFIWILLTNLVFVENVFAQKKLIHKASPKNTALIQTAN